MTDKLPKEVQEVVDEVKKNGQSVFLTELAGGRYVYRSINRSEYRKVQDTVLQLATARSHALQKKAEELGKDISDLEIEAADRSREDGEEALFKMALIDPVIENSASTNGLPAGVITKIADMIMEASGFVPGTPEVIQL